LNLHGLRLPYVFKVTVMTTNPAPAADDAGKGHLAKPSFWVLFVGSVGVVYGDIGTSPLYALRETLHAARAGGLT